MAVIIFVLVYESFDQMGSTKAMTLKLTEIEAINEIFGERQRQSETETERDRVSC